MPFDFTEVSLKWKLERLLYHLDRSTDQKQAMWCSCLVHDCLEDPLLREAGLPESFIKNNEGMFTLDWTPARLAGLNKWLKFFGMRRTYPCRDYFNLPHALGIFGNHSIEKKKAMVMKRLAKLETVS